MTGLDEFGNAVNYSATTNADGYYTIHPVLAGKYNTALAYCAGYQDAEPYTNVPPFTLPYQGTWGEMNFIMHEEFYPSPMVCAEVVQVGDDELVKVWWQIPDGTGGTGTGDFLSEYEAQVGNGSTSLGYVPFYTLYDNSVSTMLYKADELAAAGVTPAPMTSISWNASNQNGDNQQGLTIWMANVTDTQVSTTSPTSAGMTKVYTGSMTPTTGWNEFVFNENEFAWDGSSNILILMQRNNGDWNFNAINWLSHSMANAASYAYRDNTSYNMEAETYTMAISPSRPNIIFKGGTRADRADRAMHHYRIYRTDCYYDGPYYEGDPGGTVVLASAWVPDTAYFDVSWPDAAPGVYKWGVGVVYEGNQADNPNNRGAREVLFSDDFESGLDNWTLIDNGYPSGYGWEQYNDFSEMTYPAYSGNSAATSWSWATWAIDQDSWMISPLVEGATSITYYVSTNTTYPDFYYVMASSTGNATGDFSAVFSEMAPIGAKGGTGQKYSKDGNNGGERYNSPWAERTIDLPAGTKYVAFRHVDYDKNFLMIDDVTINGAGGGVGPTPTPGNTCNNMLALPRESCTVWSNECSGCIDKNMDIPSLDGEQFVSINVVLNSADSPEGTIVSFTNLHEGEQAAHPQENLTLDESGHHDFETFRRGTYAIQIYHEGFYTIFDTVGIGVEPDMAYELRYVMEEILYPARDFYVSYTGFAMWDIESGWEGGDVPTGDGGGTGANSFTEGFEGSLNGWNTIKVNADGGEWLHSDNNLGGYAYAEHAHGGTGFAMCYSFVDYDGAYDTDAILYTPQKYDIVNGSTLTFWADNANDMYPESFSVVVATVDNPTAADFTQVWSGNAKGSMGQKANVRHSNNRIDNWRLHTVDLSNYAGQSIWIGFRDTNYDAYEVFIDDVELSTGRSTRHFEYYKVMCTSIDGQPIFNVDVTTPYCQLATDQLVEDETYICKVAAVFSTGMSEWRETQWVYRSCENYAGTLNGVTINGNTISWDYPNGTGPNPDPDPAGANAFTEGFEGGLNGWNTIKVNAAGGEWLHSNDNGGGYDYTGLAHGGTGFAMCYSFIDYIGEFDTDAILYTPQKYDIVNGSTLTFYADNANDSYPENFSVVVATANNPTAADFTQVWSGGAKGARALVRPGSKDAGSTRRDTDRYENWRLHTVDLSNYAGQSVWIGFRDTNYDMYEIWIDDVTLTAGAKNGVNTNSRDNGDLANATFVSNGSSHGVVNFDNRDGWMYYDNGTQANNSPIGLSNQSTGEVFPFWWGIMFPAGTVEGTTLTKVSNYDAAANTGTIEIYQGGASAPGNLVYSQPYATNGAESVVEFELTAPVAVDATQNLWVIFHTDGGFVAAFDTQSNNANANGMWISTDGNDWETLSAATGGAYVGNWLMRAYFEDGGVAPVPVPAEGIIGAAIYQNGQPIAFVDYPTNTWTMPESGEYCVRIIYDGPMDGSYYSMSCEECEGGEVTCTADFTINGEYFWNTADDFGARLWWGEGGDDPTPPTPGEAFFDDFEAGDFVGWTAIRNGDGNEYTDWRVVNSETLFQSGPIPAHSGSHVVMSRSWNSSAFNVDNWLISPQVSLAGMLSYWVMDDGQYHEHYDVYVSTTTDDIAAFTLLYAPGNASDNWTEHTVDLSAYAGQMGYIAFRLNDYDQDYLFIDDVTIGNRSGARSDVVLYNIYRSTDNVNYELIDTVEAEAGVTAYEYIDNTAEAGVTYYYQVTAVYDNDCESTPALVEGSTNDYVVIGVTSIDENTGKVALYPNPTSGNVKIEANGMRHITVVSSLGQVVYDADVNADEMDLNMGQFTTGVYVVRIVTESGINTQRVTVVR